MIILQLVLWSPINNQILHFKIVPSFKVGTTSSTKIESGQWIVGGEISPGTYRTTASDCYYSRLSGFRGDIDDIIANGSTPKNGGIIEISASDLSFSSRCSWSKL